MALESEYLKKCLGKCLVQGLAHLVQHRPSDPIEYLAFWIYEYRRQIHASHQKMLEKLRLSEERMESLLQLEIAQKLKAEEIQFQKKHEEFQKKTITETYPEQRPRSWQEKFRPLKLPPLEEIDESLLSPNVNIFYKILAEMESFLHHFSNHLSYLKSSINIKKIACTLA